MSYWKEMLQTEISLEFSSFPQMQISFQSAACMAILSMFNCMVGLLYEHIPVEIPVFLLRSKSCTSQILGIIYLKSVILFT